MSPLVRSRTPPEESSASLVIGVYSGRAARHDSLTIGGETYRIVHAPSVLQVREALLEAERDKTPMILTTPVTESELGLDVRGRLARAKLFPVR